MYQPLDRLTIHNPLMMHTSFQIHLLLTAVNDTIASRNEGTHVSHVHRFLVKACHVPEEKLEHIDFVCTTTKWNAVKWNARHKLFGTTIALGIHCWMVVPTQTLHHDVQKGSTDFFTSSSQEWCGDCEERFPIATPEWVPSIDDHSGYFALDHLSRFSRLNTTAGNGECDVVLFLESTSW
jgi:hypothetical protein